jgi:carbon-monoxide dehydrogenase medium subunit
MIAFLEPRSIAEAVGALDKYGGEARVVGGSTAITILLRNGLIHPRALVSLGGLPDLDGIVSDETSLRIGALVTHRQVETSACVRQALPALAETFGRVANVRVRNAATVGGVLAEADYASDPPTAFLALDATVEVAGPTGTRAIPTSEFTQGFYETALEPNEIVTHVRVPIPPARTVAVYEKFVTRSSEDRPCVGAFAAVRLAPNTRICEELRVAVGAVAEVPQRFSEVEQQARGHELDADVIQAVANGYAERVETLSDLRGSSWYRTEMIRVWVQRAIEHARRRAVEPA